MSAKDRIILVIDQRSKAVPYPPATQDESENRGFQNLKGAAADVISKIPEVQDCAALRDALVAINAPRTPFFSVGCEKSLNVDEGMFWKKGFIEFSYNHAELIKDATNYFILFFHFHRLTADYAAQHPIRFIWDLQPARFKAINEGGFTCCVWIQAGTFQLQSECEDIWDNAVRTLMNFLAAVKPYSLPPIYEPTT